MWHVCQNLLLKEFWRMLHTVQDDLENTAIDPNTPHDEIMKNTISNTPQHSLSRQDSSVPLHTATLDH